ncbi:MAG: polysaccharide deacetylase family protein [Dehalococcoidia bacterium]
MRRWWALAAGGVLALVLSACGDGDGVPAGPVVTRVVPAPAGPARVVERGDASRRVVALTFDAGEDPGAGSTEQILETLQRERIRATFALTGVWAEQHRDLTLAIVAGGHQIINGTYEGRSFTGASTDAPPLTERERSLGLSRTETTIYRMTLRSTRPYVRPPYGDVDEGVRRDAAALGYGVVVLWTFDTVDLGGPEVAQQALEAASPGVIYRLHVARSEDAVALPAIIAELRNGGYSFETVEEILR